MLREDSPVHQNARQTREKPAQSCIQKKALVLVIKKMSESPENDTAYEVSFIGNQAL